jgi:hypothetical protein
MAEMTPRERLLTALRRGQPDRVPCSPHIIRWIRYHYGCTCPDHQLKLAEEFGLDLLIQYGSYVWRSVSNDYVYTPGGGYSFNALGQFGDLPEVAVELRVENAPEHVTSERTFRTPAGTLHDVIQWARPNLGYGDGPNPHRVEPLVKSRADLEALRFLYPTPRRDVLADIPLTRARIGDGGLLIATDCTHAGCWAMEALGPEGMLLASVTDPDLLKAICRLGQDQHLRNLRAMLEQGLEAAWCNWFQAGPSVGWSPAAFREFFLPLIREEIGVIHEYGAIGVYQDDGKMRDILPALVEAGIDAIGGLQPPPVGDVVLADAKRLYGDRAALIGGLDPCYTFDRGTPQAVREAVRRAVADAAAGGGYTLGTAEAIAPETPAESLRAMGATAREYGGGG